MLQGRGGIKRNNQDLNLKRTSGRFWRGKSFDTQASCGNKLHKKFWNKNQIFAIFWLEIKGEDHCGLPYFVHALKPRHYCGHLDHHKLNIVIKVN